MTAFNAVRFRVKAGRDQEFLDAHKKMGADWLGLRHVNIIKTAEHSYCIIAEWNDMNALAKARPNMIASLELIPGYARRLGRRAGRHRPSFRSGRVASQIAKGAAVKSILSGPATPDKTGRRLGRPEYCPNGLFKPSIAAPGSEASRP